MIWCEHNTKFKYYCQWHSQEEIDKLPWFCTECGKKITKDFYDLPKDYEYYFE